MQPTYNTAGKIDLSENPLNLSAEQALALELDNLDVDMTAVQEEIEKIDDDEIKGLMGNYFASRLVKKEAARQLKMQLAAKKKKENRRKNKVARQSRRRNRK